MRVNVRIVRDTCFDVWFSIEIYGACHPVLGGVSTKFAYLYMWWRAEALSGLQRHVTVRTNFSYRDSNP